jgi:putative mRNA 3-end processing factor
MKAVEGLGKIHVHYSIGKLNQAFEEVGIVLPDYEIPDFQGKYKTHCGRYCHCSARFIGFQCH